MLLFSPLIPSSCSYLLTFFPSFDTFHLFLFFNHLFFWFFYRSYPFHRSPFPLMFILLLILSPFPSSSSSIPLRQPLFFYLNLILFSSIDQTRNSEHNGYWILTVGTLIFRLILSLDIDQDQVPSYIMLNPSSEMLKKKAQRTDE